MHQTLRGKLIESNLLFNRSIEKQKNLSYYKIFFLLMLCSIHNQNSNSAQMIQWLPKNLKKKKKKKKKKRRNLPSYFFNRTRFLEVEHCAIFKLSCISHFHYILSLSVACLALSFSLLPSFRLCACLLACLVVISLLYATDMSMFSKIHGPYFFSP